jgi:hypothetical protein
MLTNILLVILIFVVWHVGSTLLNGVKVLGEILEGISNLIRNSDHSREKSSYHYED